MEFSRRVPNALPILIRNSISTNLKPGTRVVRGPDWNRVNQDNGEGFLGTIIFVPKPDTADKKVTVIWDSGRELRYRAGEDGKYDLRIFDTAQIGVAHEHIACNSCKARPIAGIRWKCATCKDVDLCSPCYMSDKHNTKHGFVRFDVENATPWVVAKRDGSRSTKCRGLCVGTEVIRGPHWEYKNQDGGEGEVGEVVKIEAWNSHAQRGCVCINWRVPRETHRHRLGGDGRVDVIYRSSKQAQFGGKYYIEHLPLVDVVSKGSYTVALKPSDKVKVTMDLAALRKLHDNSDKYGKWSDEIQQCIDEEGTIVQLLSKAEVAKVQYLDGRTWDINHMALTRVHTFSKNDVVIILRDKEQVKMLQKGHGGWNDDMIPILGKKGRIARIDSDGDIRVRVDDRLWIFNPVCLSTYTDMGTSVPPPLGKSAMAEAEGSSDESEMGASGKDMSESIAQLSVKMLKAQPTMQAGSANIVKAAVANNLSEVQEVLTHHPEKVDFTEEGKTALHLACYSGYAQIVHLLLENKASKDKQDGEGDTALHYATFGMETMAMELLLAAGAKVNMVNKHGQSPLHIAIGKASVEAVKLLVNHGSDVTLKDNDGDTIMHDSIQQKQGQPEIMQAVLWARTADCTITNKKEFNVLLWAGIKDVKKAVEIILSQNMNLVNDQMTGGFSILHIVAANNFVDITQYLVTKSHGLDINIRDKDKKTPLHFAVLSSHKQVIELLIAAGADVNAQDINGNTALHLALSTPVLPRESAQIMGTKRDHDVETQIICLLLEARANITIKNNDQETPVQLADPMVRKFMERSVNQAQNNKFEKKQKGINLPLHWDPMSRDDAFCCMTVSVAGGGTLRMEYVEVAKKFHHTLPQATVFGVTRVQNIFLWEVYSLKKRQMEGLYGMGGANELELFHGTLPDKIDQICKENLDPRLAGDRVGAIFGQGTYFAVEAKYSDLYAQADARNHKFMVLTRVLGGKCCVGKKQYRRPPTVDPKDKNLHLYDCCVDNVQKPKIYCLFDTNQYYPEYIIEYM